MPKIFIHLQQSNGAEMKNLERNFIEIPRIGEFVSLQLNEEKSNETFFEVYLVIHVGVENAEYDADVYAVERNYENFVQRKILDAK